MKLKTLLEGALIGAAKEIEGSKRALTWSGLAEIVARYPELSEGYSLYLKAKAQRDAVEAELAAGIRTVHWSDGELSSYTPLAKFSMSAPIDNGRGDGGTEV